MNANAAKEIRTFPRGIFTISIDHEFAWTTPEVLFTPQEKEIVRKETLVIRRLLSLFEEFHIPATWAIVAHLLETACPWAGSIPHPDYPRPVSFQEGDTDWFFQHPVQSDTKDLCWFDAEQLIPAIIASSMKHEIGSHSYAHIEYGAPDTNPDAVKFDIRKAQSMHRAFGLPFEAFIFPRNKEGFHTLLKEAGVRWYRGNTVRWYRFLPSELKRVARLFDYLMAVTPPMVMPSVHPSGLINIPDSMLFISREGVRKFVPGSMLKRKAIKGLQRAVAERRIFHLWLHASNFSYETEKQFSVFIDILKEAQKLRKQDKLDVLTMSQVANTLEAK